VGYIFVDDDRLLDDGKQPDWTGPASFDGTLSGGSIDLVRVFLRDIRISPYILGGIGMRNSNYEGIEGDENVTASVGGGLMCNLARNADGSRTVQLRPKVRSR
jgi:hypothetical protein